METAVVWCDAAVKSSEGSTELTPAEDHLGKVCE